MQHPATVAQVPDGHTVRVAQPEGGPGDTPSAPSVPRLGDHSAADRPCARQAGPQALAQALQASRADTLTTFEAYRAALGDTLAVPCDPALNPPLWELGHIGWFQDWWIARNPQRAAGTAADPLAPRAAPPPPGPAGADALYNSSLVPHATRWQLPLPDAAGTLALAEAALTRTLAHLAALPTDAGDAALYFHRLALFHEDMHHEAALYMAQALGITITDARWQPSPLPPPAAPLRLAGGTVALGWPGPGFAFDNECPVHPVAVAPLEIDAQVLRWAEFLPFVAEGGYHEPCWWTPEGLQWLAAQPQPSHEAQAPLTTSRTATLDATRHASLNEAPKAPPNAPRYLRLAAGSAGSRSANRLAAASAPARTGCEPCDWEVWHHGRWQPLDPQWPACHLSLHEAQAWCNWAGRRLPTEAEWQFAAQQAGPAFRWGDVWEWTASAFAPYPGFRPHPYQDYSQPWFDGRPVLRGASFGTQPRLRSLHYRNYFPAGRNDIFAGFRTCARR